MKCISIRQPWAWLIVEGHKDIENRQWFTRFRGNILIHAAKGCTNEEYIEALEFVHGFNPALAMRIPSLARLPKGGIVGMAMISGCVQVSPSPWFVGRFGFQLEKRYPLPFRPLRGMLGIFNVNDYGQAEPCEQTVPAPNYATPEVPA